MLKKRCIDCRWCKQAWHGAGGEFSKCYHPNVAYVEPYFCKFVREVKVKGSHHWWGACGPEAKLFEPKPPGIWTRIWWWLNNYRPEDKIYE